MKKKMLSLLLVAAMLCSLVPAAFAAEYTPGPVVLNISDTGASSSGATALVKTIVLTQSAPNKLSMKATFTAGDMSGGYTKWMVGAQISDDDLSSTTFDTYTAASGDLNGSNGSGTALTNETEESLATDVAISDNVAGQKYGILVGDSQTDAFGYAEFEIKDGAIVVPKATYALKDNNGDALTGITDTKLLPKTYTADELKAAVNVTPTKTGYTFAGWSDTQNGTTATGLTVADASATGALYAVWTANEISMEDTTVAVTYGDTNVSKELNKATNGTGTYTYSTTDTALLPTGLSLDPAGKITGTANAATADTGVEITVTATDSGSTKTTTAKVTIKVAKATPTVTVPSATEGMTLEEVLAKVTVTGVKDGDLDKTGFKFVKEDGTTELSTDELKAPVVAETPYYYTYTPSGTGAANYNAVPKTTKVLLGQSKVNITFTSDPEMGTVKNGTLSGGVSTVTTPVTVGDKITAPDVTNTDPSQARFCGWTLDPEADPLVVLTTAQVNATDAATDAEYFAVFDLPDHPAYMIGVDTDNKLFDPNGSLTRAQAAVMLARLDGYDVKQPYNVKSNYDDMKDHAKTAEWAQNAIDYVTDKKYMNGRGKWDGYNNAFDPDAYITRQEMAVILARICVYTDSAVDTSFSDIGEADAWAKDAINALKKADVVSGDGDGKFRPKDTIKRTEAAKMVNYAYDCIPDDTKISKDLLRFTDMKGAADWAVYNVIEATVDHFSEDFHK